MANQKLTLSVRPRGKPVQKLPEEVSITLGGTANELYHALALRAGTSIHQLRVTKGSDGALVPNRKDLKLETTGLREQSTIYVKDLGPQIAWRTVFLVEYAGPLIIHPVLYALLPSPQASQLQSLTLCLVCLHFAKRELETLFVHRFSSATMPAFNILKNGAHYWLLSGLNMAFWIYRSSAPAAKESNPYITYAGLTLFAMGEIGNLVDHITLRNLRSAGGTERKIPQGLGFNWVTCPNYMFEIIAWTGIAMVSWSLSIIPFAIIAIGQMGIWAKKKESAYRREFGGKYKRKRYTMLPLVW